MSIKIEALKWQSKTTLKPTEDNKEKRTMHNKINVLQKTQSCGIKSCHTQWHSEKEDMKG